MIQIRNQKQIIIQILSSKSTNIPFIFRLSHTFFHNFVNLHIVFQQVLLRPTCQQIHALNLFQYLPAPQQTNPLGVKATLSNKIKCNLTFKLLYVLSSIFLSFRSLRHFCYKHFIF